MPNELRILVLEDSHNDAELAIATLEQAGYTCQWDYVSTRAAFAERMGNRIYDLILSDYNLPDFDGISAVQLLRQHHPDLPFILVSGILGEETAIESLKAGATDYVIKSHLARLAPVVGRALREREEQRQRREAELALRRAEARYRELFENANDMIYTRDIAGRFTSVNSMGEQLTAYSRDELLSMTIYQLIAPEYLPSVLDSARRQRGGAGQIAQELELVRKDGARVWVEINTRLIYEEGRPVGVQGIARDISERRRAQDEHRQLEDQLLQAQKMESIGTLAGGVAHDFNNMLTAIIGNIQLVLEDCPPESPDFPLLNEAEKAAMRASALTRQLLTFSRRQPLERRTIDLNATINDLSHMLRRIIGEDVEIDIRLSSSATPIFADPAQIQQVVMNLAVNARDAMPQGGKLSISTSIATLSDATMRLYGLGRPGNYIRLVISDTGVGIDPETQQRIFEPFFTTKEPGKGTGLGLAVVYGIVKQHEGFVHVESQLAAGSTFTIFLPAPDTLMAPADVEETPEVRGGSETILVAEDEESLRYLISTVLERLGYQVLLAEDGDAAVRLFQKNPAGIDLAILDLVMPRSGGREAFEQMRVLRPDLRALFVTGYDDRAARSSGSNTLLPGTWLLQKPYHVDALGLRVREILDYGV